jgi:D-alanyl-D-alanine carboxypeptidase (penicillin-binding protein 5/6)
MDLIRVSKKNIFFIVVIFLILVLSFFYIKDKKEKSIFVLTNQEITEKEKFDYDSVLNTVEAKSYYVYDILNKKNIFSKNEHEQLPLASITKLMSGFVVLDIVPETSVVTVSRNDILQEGDSGLLLNEKWRLKDLLEYTLITSSNDGMHAISSLLDDYSEINSKNTVELMNERASFLGLNDTYFVNTTGLDVDKEKSGAYSSAYDVSILLEKILTNNPKLFLNTDKTSESFMSLSKIKHTAINTNLSINQIPNLIASKTGFTNLAGGNLAVIFDAGFMHPIAIVVLGSSIEGRFSDVVKLSEMALKKLSE